MFDVTVPDKNVMDNIARMMNNSVSKADIFNSLKYNYIQFTQESLAVKISSFIASEVKQKFKIPVDLLAAVITIRLFSSIVSFLSSPQLKFSLLHWVIAIAVWSVILILMTGILRYQLSSYSRAISLYSIVILLEVIRHVSQPSPLGFLDLIGEILILIFLLLLRKKIFPNINLWGHVLKDANKNFIFK
jgi:hypothetical protein